MRRQFGNQVMPVTEYHIFWSDYEFLSFISQKNKGSKNVALVWGKSFGLAQILVSSLLSLWIWLALGTDTQRAGNSDPRKSGKIPIQRLRCHQKGLEEIKNKEVKNARI